MSNSFANHGHLGRTLSYHWTVNVALCGDKSTSVLSEVWANNLAFLQSAIDSGVVPIRGASRRCTIFCGWDSPWLRRFVTTKPSPDTVHSPNLGQLHVESNQLACTCALCCCYALCMKREELSLFHSLWLRCFVDMLQYVGFLGRSQLFGSQVKVGAPTWHLARANCKVGAPSAKLARQFGAPTLELAPAKSGFGVCQLPNSSCWFAPFMHSLCLLGISVYYAPKATQEGQGEEGDIHRPHVCPRQPRGAGGARCPHRQRGFRALPRGLFSRPLHPQPPDGESFPQLPPLREPLEAALFGKWDQPGNP